MTDVDDETTNCANCGKALTDIGQDCEYRHVSATKDGDVLEIRFAPLCAICLAEDDPKEIQN